MSRRHLEAIALRYTTAYYRRLNVPVASEPVKMETLAEFMRLRLMVLPLCKDSSVLGLATFDSMDLNFTMEDGSTEIIEMTDHDIVIDAFLHKHGIPGRINYTLAHEISHHILLRQFPGDYGPSCNRLSHVYYRFSSKRQNRWIEWQADNLASCLLMPRALIVKSLADFGLGDRMKLLNSVFAVRDYKKFCTMADFLGVSKKALAIRLKRLGLLDRDYLDDPYELVRVYKDEDEDEN